MIDVMIDETNIKEVHELYEVENAIKEEILQKFEQSGILNSKELYSVDVAIEKYEYILQLVEQYIEYYEPAKEAFSKHIEQIQKWLGILKTGKEGEKEVFESVKLMGSKVKYLTNVSLSYKDIDVEEDLIIIAPTGIFSVEIKNWKDNAKLNEKGILSCTKSGKEKTVDIVNQVRRHCFCLYEILAGKNIFSKDQMYDCVHSIILWQNKSSEIEDEFHKIPIRNSNDLEYEIFDYTKYEKVFSMEDIEKIFSVLDSEKTEGRKYPLRMPENFVEEFILNATMQVREEREKLESMKTIPEDEEFIWTHQEENKIWRGTRKVLRGIGKAAVVTTIVAGIIVKEIIDN